MISKTKQDKPWSSSLEDWANIQEPKGKDIYDIILKKLEIKLPAKLLDIGCATGFFMSLANAKGTDVSGIDAADVFIEEAKKRLPSAVFVMAEMGQLPFEDRSFDVVCGFNSFQYAGNTKRALIEAKRVLTDRGKLATMVWGDKEKCEIATFLKEVYSLLPPMPVKGSDPFSLSEEKLLPQLLKEIGFIKINTSSIITTWNYPDVETAIKGLLSLGALAKAVEYNSIEKVRNAIMNALQPYLQSNGHVVYHNQYRIVISEK